MADGNGDKWVTWRDLGEKLDDVYETIDGRDGIRERVTRIEVTVDAILQRLNSKDRHAAARTTAIIGACATVAAAAITAIASLL